MSTLSIITCPNLQIPPKNYAAISVFGFEDHTEIVDLINEYDSISIIFVESREVHHGTAPWVISAARMSEHVIVNLDTITPAGMFILTSMVDQDHTQVTFMTSTKDSTIADVVSHGMYTVVSNVEELEEVLKLNYGQPFFD